MKLSCLQENLNRGLGVVGRAVAVRPTLPITSNVLLTTDKSRLKLVATNLEMAISHWIGAKVEEEGSITIPARLLTEFIGSLSNDRVDIELKDGKALELKCARYEAKISGIDVHDFPPIPKVEDGVNCSVEVTAFKQAISESRPENPPQQGRRDALSAQVAEKLGIDRQELENATKEAITELRSENLDRQDWRDARPMI